LNTEGGDKAVYLCELGRKIYGCSTPIQCGFFTLDNAKYWILNFYYNFMEKCLDHNRFHYVEGDTDSLYFAISGNLVDKDGVNQGFKNIITDEKFYNENVYKWLPSDFYSSNNTNPKFNDVVEKMSFDNKLLGFAIERKSQHMIALAPKMDTAFNDISTLSLKLKGVSLKQANLNSFHYLHVLEDQTAIRSEQRNLRMYRNLISKINMTKCVLSPFHKKYVVLEDFSTCGPFL
jgi:hypothetical protein